MDAKIVNEVSSKIDKPMKLFLLPYRVSAYEYVSFVLFQDAVVSILNILIVCIELDNYKDYVNFVYAIIALPCIQLLLTFIILLTRYDLLKTNMYQQRMKHFNTIRLAFVLVSLSLIITHDAIKSAQWFDRTDKDTMTGVACLLYVIYAMLYAVFFTQYFKV